MGQSDHHTNTANEFLTKARAAVAQGRRLQAIGD